jgi:uncharacterized protein YebE (UPF0316 family)
MTPEALLTALIIFLLRVFNNAISTVRVVFITRDKRLWSAVLAFIEAFTFIVVVSSVARDLNNLPNMLAYCGGFAVGGYVGMALEARLFTSYVIALIFAQERGHAIAVALRERGFGVTETSGEGRDGEVTILRCVLQRRDVRELTAIVRKIYADAFISLVEAKAVDQGWLRGSRQTVDDESSGIYRRP